jgi:hypothetical protein
MDQRKINWVSWVKVYLPEEDGGLGVKICICSIWNGLSKFRYGPIEDKVFNLDRDKFGRLDSLWWQDLCLMLKKDVLELN